MSLGSVLSVADNCRGKFLYPRSLCLPFRPDPCTGVKRGVDCQHLSESRFKCYVAFWMKGDVSKGKERSKSSGGSDQRRRDSC